MVTAAKRVVLRDVSSRVSNRQEFQANKSLSGGRHIHAGRLPEPFRAEFWAAIKAPDFYVVHSYQTPIAWFANGAWMFPPVKYSVTTTRHQSYVARGIG